MNPDNGKNTKPDSVHGVRFAWQIGGERPAWGSAMYAGQFTRKPFILCTYTEEDRKKTVWYAACYENTRSEAGSWSRRSVHIKIRR